MPDQEYDQQQDWGKVAESAFVFLVFTGAGVIIGLLLCRPSAAGLTQSTSGLQVVINDSTTTAEVGVGQELTYVIEGATPDGLVSIIIQDTPAPIQPDASATETTANAIIAAAEEWAKHHSDADPTAPPEYHFEGNLVQVRNDGSYPMARFSVAGLTTALITPSQNLKQFQSYPRFSVRVPTAADFDNFCVLVEQIAVEVANYK